MTQGLATTFRLLTKTKNEAAIGLLIPALDSAHASVSEQALRAILDRHSVTGQKEIVRRLHQFDERWRSIIDQRHGRMSAALRDAVLAAEPQLCQNGCQAILWFHEYDLMPALINAAEDESNPNREMATATVLQLAELLYEELAARRDYRNRRDPQLARQHVIGSLEGSVKRFAKHRILAVIEAFLLLVHRDNATLKTILADPLDSSYRPIVEVLTHSHRPGIFRLVLSFLDDPHAPSSSLTLLAHRSDLKFVESLVRKIGYEPTGNVAMNVKKIDTVPWLQGDFSLLRELDDNAQFGAVQLAVRSGMARKSVFTVIEFLTLHGRVGGRRAASAALAKFNGAEANALALKALDDPDPQVQANAVGQLRPRGIPGVLGRLVDMVASPHDIVRRAVRENLAEFTFSRFLASFDILDDDIRRTTGEMVRKIDFEALDGVRQELVAKSRTRRLRAVKVVVALNVAEQLEEALIARLADEDHLVRSEVARALGACNTPRSRAALEKALEDRSLVVREAADAGLKPFGPEIPSQSQPAPLGPTESLLPPTQEFQL